MPETFATEESNTAELNEEERDLGFGSVVAARQGRLLNRDGSFNAQRTGINPLSSLYLYHWLLNLSWRQFLGLSAVLYLTLNLLFAIAFWLCGPESLADTSVHPTANHFVRAFFFSVHTFATIGYGTLQPIGGLANWLVTVEAFIGILTQALVTGMVFARFSRPTARILFSEKAIVGPYRGGRGFMFRLVNGRNNQLIEVQIQVMFARFVQEGENRVRRFELLKLERQRVTFLPLAWTVVHPIDDNSPLQGLALLDLFAADAEFLILLTGVEEDFAQMVHSRSSYRPEEVLWNTKFVPIFNDTVAGEPMSIDVRKLSQTEPA